MRPDPAPEPDDERLARLLRAIRRRGSITQRQLSASAGVTRDAVLRIEAARSGDVRLRDIRSAFASAGGRVRVSVWWNGAAADRILDERHALLVERTVAIFRASGWRTLVEATFSEFGERGSIDILGGHDASHIGAVVEVMTEWGSLEETNRILDMKERLAPKLIVERFGWRPLAVGRILVIASDSTARRVVTRHEATMSALYPARSREVRAWVRRPQGAVRGLWFLSEVRDIDRVPSGDRAGRA